MSSLCIFCKSLNAALLSFTSFAICSKTLTMCGPYIVKLTHTRFVFDGFAAFIAFTGFAAFTAFIGFAAFIAFPALPFFTDGMAMSGRRKKVMPTSEAAQAAALEGKEGKGNAYKRDGRRKAAALEGKTYERDNGNKEPVTTTMMAMTMMAIVVFTEWR